MPIYKIEQEKFSKLQDTSFQNEGLYEVNNLQKYLASSINVIDPDLYVISTEFSEWIDSRRSIDILCIDRDANLVVIELKRTRDGGHMELQAVRYAAMLANMKFKNAVKVHESYLRKIGSNSDAETEIRDFLGWSEILEDDFAQDVRIILVSADFSKELTTSVLWLIEREIDIKCVRIRPQKDNGILYFDIQQIIPLPEAEDYQVKLKEKFAEEREIRKKQNGRGERLVKKLFELELLAIGQKVHLKPALEQKHPEDLAEAIIARRGQNCLKRIGDSKFYSFSGLRALMVDELKLQGVKPEWGFTLKDDWMTNGKTLAELAEAYYQNPSSAKNLKERA